MQALCLSHSLRTACMETVVSRPRIRIRRHALLLCLRFAWQTAPYPCTTLPSVFPRINTSASTQTIAHLEPSLSILSTHTIHWYLHQHGQLFPSRRRSDVTNHFLEYPYPHRDVLSLPPLLPRWDRHLPPHNNRAH